MNAFAAIARKELTQLRVAPSSYVLLACTAALAAYLFLIGLDAYPELSKRLAGTEGAPGVSDLVVAPYLAEAAGLLLLLVPLLAMRTLVDERRAGTLALLFAGGAGDFEIVAGKYLGLLGFVALALAILVALPATLGFGTTLDWGRLAAGAFGLALVAAAQAAIGVLASAYAGHAAAAAFACYAATALLWFVDAAARMQGTTEELINYAALPTHLTPFLRGVVSSVNLTYFAIIVCVALALAARRVRQIRERGA